MSARMPAECQIRQSRAYLLYRQHLPERSKIRGGRDTFTGTHSYYDRQDKFGFCTNASR